MQIIDGKVNDKRKFGTAVCKTVCQWKWWRNVIKWIHTIVREASASKFVSRSAGGGHSASATARRAANQGSKRSPVVLVSSLTSC